MQSFFTYEEGSLLVRLLISYIITEFLVSRYEITGEKKRAILKERAFWLKVLFTGSAAALFMFRQFDPAAILFLMIGYASIKYCIHLLHGEAIRKKWENREPGLNIADQLLQTIMLTTAWLIAIDGFGKMSAMLAEILPGYHFLLRVLGYLIVTGPATYLIKYMTSRWSQEVTGKDNSLQDAGKWIGMLERSIVITMVYLGQFTAIGFLVTAKSILRLIDKPDVPAGQAEEKPFSPRKHTEYVLIGTFLSFGAALLTGLAINMLLAF